MEIEREMNLWRCSGGDRQKAVMSMSKGENSKHRRRGRNWRRRRRRNNARDRFRTPPRFFGAVMISEFGMMFA